MFAAAACLLGDLVHLKGEIPAQQIHAICFGPSLPVPMARLNSAAICATSPTLTGASTAPT